MQHEVFKATTKHMPVLEEILKQENISYMLESNGEITEIYLTTTSKAQMERVCYYLQGAYRALVIMRRIMQPSINVLS
jgi:hypothetical protein